MVKFGEPPVIHQTHQGLLCYTVCTWLGFDIDFVKVCISVPEAKLNSLHSQLAQAIARLLKATCKGSCWSCWQDYIHVRSH